MAQVDAVFQCPHCKDRQLETVATLPFVRGTFRGSHFGVRTISGCVPCVRKLLLSSTADASVKGWSSLAGMIINPIMIIYGMCRALIVVKNPPRVRAMLHTAGVSDAGEQTSAVRTSYSLAAALIGADNKILPQEIATAATIGKQIFPEFNVAEFIKTVRQRNTLPDPDELSSLLGATLNEDTKNAVYRYLVAIATSDREVAPEEQEILETVARNMRISGAGSGVDTQA